MLVLISVFVAMLIRVLEMNEISGNNFPCEFFYFVKAASQLHVRHMLFL